MKYRLVMSCHMNFFPGTMTPTPPDYRFELGGKLRESPQHAHLDLAEARTLIDHPEDWMFEVREVTVPVESNSAVSQSNS